MPLLLASAASNDIAHAVLILSLIAVAGLSFGSIKIRGIGLGTAGVMFSGILFGHFGFRIDPTILEFVREFGLILFVFCIGLQLGPGFFASLRKDGLRQNGIAAAVILGGAVVAVLSGWLLKISPMASVGLFTGATTNTPALGAAQQTLISVAGASDARAALPALAYAVSYPFGIVGIISALLILKAWFRIDPETETKLAEEAQHQGTQPLKRMNLIVENPNLDGVALSDVPGRIETRVVVSRIRRRDETTVEPAFPDLVLHSGDSILAVGTKKGLEDFRKIVGRVGNEDLRQAPGQATFKHVLVTKSEALGRTVDELGLDSLYGVTVTRISRGGLEMPVGGDLRLKFGDTAHVVGTPEAIQQSEKVLGNSIKVLNQTQFIPLFIGIALGVLLGLGPLEIPGLPVPVRLGLAGGPLVLAILLGWIGNFRRLVWHMPPNANLAFRELGMILFLACVGLKAGSQFFSTVFTKDGALWVLSAIPITLIPLLAAGVFARVVWKMNYPAMAGLLSGSMTDPPALAFANTICKSDLPAVSYAAVYPLAMLLRIVAAQVLVLILLK